MKISAQYVKGVIWIAALFSYGIAKPFLILFYFSQVFVIIGRTLKLTTFSSLLFIYIASWFPYVLMVGDFSVLSNYIALWLGFVFYFATRDYSDYFLKTILCITVFACLDAFYQFIIGVDVFGIPLYAGARATGPFTWPSPVIGSFVAILFFLPAIVVKSTFLRMLIQIFFLITILISGNRSNILQIIVVTFLFTNNNARILLLLVIGSMFIYYEELLRLLDFTALIRIVELFSYDEVIALESAPGRRFHMWQYLYQNLDLVTFLFGAGVGMSEVYISEIYPYGYIHPHHFYLELFYNLGVIGLSILVVIVVASYRKFNREQRRNFLLFWGPFNMLHSINDLFWLSMLVINLIIVYYCRTNSKMKN